MLIEKIIAWCTGSALVLSALYSAFTINRPMDINVRLKERSEINQSLPILKDAKVTITLDNDEITKVISDINSVAVFPNIPKKKLGKKVKVTVRDSLNLYNKIDTTLPLTEEMRLAIYRNPQKYGLIKFRLLDSKSLKPITHCKVSIEDIEGVTDENGKVSIEIPMAKQKTKFHIKADVELENSICNGEYDADDFVVFARQNTPE